MRRTERRRADPVDDVLQRKAELERLVQRDLERTRHHLHAACEALGRPQ